MPVRNLINMPKPSKTVKAMREYLADHFRYYTMSSWNGLSSFAVNIKAPRLNITREELHKVYEVMEVDGAYSQSGFEDEFLNFEGENEGYEIFTNGRSGGYAVLGRKKTSRGVSYDDFMSNDDVRHLYQLVRSFDEHVNFACLNFLDFSMRVRVIEKEVEFTKKVRVFEDPELAE